MNKPLIETASRRLILSRCEDSATRKAAVIYLRYDDGDW
jgi:hypothetical protein